MDPAMADVPDVGYATELLKKISILIRHSQETNYHYYRAGTARIFFGPEKAFEDTNKSFDALMKNSGSTHCRPKINYQVSQATPHDSWATVVEKKISDQNMHPKVFLSQFAHF